MWVACPVRFLLQLDSPDLGLGRHAMFKDTPEEEYQRLVAQRILRFADIVGRERVIAGSDCGFSTFVGFGAVDENIVYARLGAMAEGAAIATDELWGAS